MIGVKIQMHTFCESGHNLLENTTKPLLFSSGGFVMMGR